ncbi:hypothetical protein QM091_15340 [Enterobacter roggenkampii]|uniref:hypothetical protein n=1 Tax=Enterobacter roggenkampii TaxID=1812935 RepID=UPI002948DC02|nr:hypothetical protein [Enterobacter roggenkampii]MDV5320216.1 hypothetical protein [Enterobacter roggenkampii]MDV5330164.1 hypothetical protein [Enterobacter roggenkampii]MDV5681154.1 hypothetical protein [Enterobacter roggenkampii]
MSNIDKHAVQAVADLKAGYRLGHADVAILNELARIALASLEAEPVAWLLSGGGAKNNVSFDSGNAYADPLREVTPLYTAPPAPVSVPAAMEMDDDFDSAFEHGKAVGWNAYRAAMLQGADGNSPVIAKAYDIEAFGVFSATECESGLLLQIEQFLFGTENCLQVGKGNMIPKFALQAIINRLQEHCDSMGNEALIDILSTPVGAVQGHKE